LIERLVIDSGVLIKWFLDEPLYPEARRIRDEYRTGTLTLVAPDLIYAEVGNILWKKQRFQGLSSVDAADVLMTLKGYPIPTTPAAALLDDAYHLAVTHGRTVYDALYLALSVREGCRFVTADERLANAVGAALPNVVWVANWL
jgi:predicted nucleic acid-binding protein